jgi:uncharacterized membrane protein
MLLLYNIYAVFLGFDISWIGCALWGFCTIHRIHHPAYGRKRWSFRVHRERGNRVIVYHTKHPIPDFLPSFLVPSVSRILQILAIGVVLRLMIYDVQIVRISMDLPQLFDEYGGKSYSRNEQKTRLDGEKAVQERQYEPHSNTPSLVGWRRQEVHRSDC